MYIRFVLYTCMLQLFRQTLFDNLFHVFYVLVFTTKHIFGLNDKNHDIYMFLVY